MTINTITFGYTIPEEAINTYLNNTDDIQNMIVQCADVANGIINDIQ